MSRSKCTEALTTLHMLLSDYPTTHALKQGTVRSEHVAFDFADVKVAHTAFKRVVRDLEFDVAELALVTFLTVPPRLRAADKRAEVLVSFHGVVYPVHQQQLNLERREGLRSSKFPAQPCLQKRKIPRKPGVLLPQFEQRSPGIRMSAWPSAPSRTVLDATSGRAQSTHAGDYRPPARR